MADERNQGPEAELVYLKVQRQNNSVVQFKMKKRTPLRKLMKTFCNIVGLSMQVVRFRFNDQPINGNDTNTTLQMKDGDTIQVYLALNGGGSA